MRKGDHGFQRSAVDRVLAVVQGIGIGLKDLVISGALESPGQIGPGDVVDADDTALGARLNGHVGHAHARLHGEGPDGGAHKFYGLVQGAVCADSANHLQNQILAVNALAQRAVQYELHGAGDLEPQLARGNGCGQVRGTNARAERAECAVGTCVRVASDNDLARANVSLFGEQGVTDTCASKLVVVLDAFFLGPGVQAFVQFRALDILGRLKVIWCHCNLLGIKHGVNTLVLEHGDRRGGGDIVTHDHVNIGIHEVARRHGGLTGGLCEYLLCNCLSHRYI